MGGGTERGVMEGLGTGVVLGMRGDPNTDIFPPPPQVLPRPKSLGGAPPGREGGWRETLRAWWGARRPPRPAPPAPPP